MNDEAGFKSHFKKSARKQGGYCISLAAPMISGIPDLYCIMPGFVPVLIEAKWLGTLNDKFKRKIQYTPMQRMVLDEVNTVYPNAALGLIGFKYKGKLHSVLKPRILKETDECIDNNMLTGSLPFCVNTPNIDVALLFSKANVARINGINFQIRASAA